MKYLMLILCLPFIISACISYGDRAIAQNYNLPQNQLLNALEDSNIVQGYKAQVFFSKPYDTSLKYIEISNIVVEGAKFTTDDEMLQLLKKEALNLNAHAIINTQASFKTKTQGYYTFKPLQDNTLDTFQAKVYEGTAIRYKRKVQGVKKEN